LNHVAGLTKPLRLFVGEEEIPELKRQSLDYASSAQRLGVPVSLTRIPRRHHFSILDEFTRDGVLTTALLSQADSSGAAHR
jgi:arylformamidase